MKKITSLLLIAALLLCGCDESEGASSTQEPVTEAQTRPEYIDEDVTLVEYSSLNEFKSSEFFSRIKSSGYTPYLLQYDESRYTLKKITSDADFYIYYLYDNEAEQEVRYNITFNAGYENINQLQEAYQNSKNVLTTAERNGQEYDVYLVTSPYDSQEDYGLLYLPFEDYKSSIYAGNSSTKEEILSYFDDFELVADN